MVDWSPRYTTTPEAVQEAIRCQIREMLREGNSRNEIIAILKEQALDAYPLESMIALEIEMQGKLYRVGLFHGTECSEGANLEYEVRAHSVDQAKARALAVFRRTWLGGDLYKTIKEDNPKFRIKDPFTLKWPNLCGQCIAHISVNWVEEVCLPKNHLK